MTGGRAIGLLLAAGLVLALGIGTAVTAPDTDSPWSLMGGGGGGTATSTNFETGASAGQTAIGQAESTAFRLGAGYWYGGRDQDGDLLAHSVDNCPSVSNAGQANTDTALAAGGATLGGAPLAADGLGDACDADDDNDSGAQLATRMAGPCIATSVPVFDDCVEGYLGTGPLDNCVLGPGVGGDAWPPDVTANGFVDTGDIGTLTNNFGDPVPGGAPARHDLTANGFIDTGDIALVTGRFGLGCS